MIAFCYDHTFEGLLTAVFEAYARKRFPDALLREGEPPPLFCEETVTVITDEGRAERVWNALQRKLSATALGALAQSWLAEAEGVDMMLFRYIRKAVDAPRSIETNFADTDVLELARLWKKVDGERLRMMQFVRFQKAADGTFFAAVEPRHNVLPLVTAHFKDRFADQRWLIYDIGRRYGFYYDLHTVEEVTFAENRTPGPHLTEGRLHEAMMDKDEKLFQQLWKTYFKATCIKERLNPRKHRQDMPVRYWKYLTEKQPS